MLHRKDSFITHRAFCDALAEESARLTSVSTSTNLSFKSEEATTVMSTQPGLAHGLMANVGVPHFGPHGFCLDFNGMGMVAEQQIRPNLSLWLNQGNRQINPLHVSSSSSSSGLSEIVQMAQASNNALNGSSSSMLPNFGMPAPNSTSANLSLSPLPTGKKVEAGGTADLASIYSESQNKQSKPASASPMSATALLQKAAQMGSTRSTNPSTFSGSFGVMTSSSIQSNSLNNNNANQNRGSAAMLGSSTNFSSLTHSSNSFDQFVMQTSEPVQLKLHNPGANNAEHDLTRDFLGVSRGGAGRPFLPQQLAKFASIGSSMGLSQFTASHH